MEGAGGDGEGHNALSSALAQGKFPLGHGLLGNEHAEILEVLVLVNLVVGGIILGVAQSVEQKADEVHKVGSDARLVHWLDHVGHLDVADEPLHRLLVGLAGAIGENGLTNAATHNLLVCAEPNPLEGQCVEPLGEAGQVQLVGKEAASLLLGSSGGKLGLLLLGRLGLSSLVDMG